MSLIFQFPGNGCQYPGMGEDYKNHEFYKIAEEIIGINLSEICQNGTEEDLKKTEIAQPLIFTVSAIIYTELEKNGLKPKYVLGHSLGQYNAAHASKAITYKIGLKLVWLRAQYMQKAVPLGVGGMVAVMSLTELNENEIIQICDETGCFVANFNSKKQLTISGTMVNINKAIELLKKKKYKTILLDVSVPFHCPLLESIVEEFKEELLKVEIKNGNIPIISNVTARCIISAKGILEEFVNQITASVRWSESISNIAAINKSNTFVEIGSKKQVLTNLLKDNLPKGDSSQKFTIYDQKTLKEFLQKR